MEVESNKLNDSPTHSKEHSNLDLSKCVEDVSYLFFAYLFLLFVGIELFIL